MKRLCFLLLFICSTLSANPWGKDADLASKPISTSCPTEKCKTPFLGWFGEVMIGFHQKIISPADGPRSHFLPSSSQYALDAMRKHGFFQGVAMGCDRLMRENKEPWIYRKRRDAAGNILKYDPVP